MTATKDSTVSFPLAYHGLQTFSYQGPIVTDDVRVYPVVRTRTGTRLPKWRKVIKDGGNATTSLTATFDTFDSSSPTTAVMKYRRTTGHTAEFTVKGDVGILNPFRYQKSDFPIDPGLPTTIADNLAKARFYKRLYSAQTKFEGLTFLGELRESLRMLRRPAAALWGKNLGYLDALGKAKRASPKHWLKTVGGLWLEHSFGWQPLINDCKDAVTAYEQLVRPTPKPVVVSGGGIWMNDRTSSLGSIWKNGWLAELNGIKWLQSDCIFTEEHTVRYKGAVRAQVEAPHWKGWDLFGFTPQNIIPTAWELLPWSFLVDYFTNIGDILQASITSTRSLVYINKTVIQKTRYRGRMVPQLESFGGGLLPPFWSIVSASGQEYNWDLTRKLVNRSANSGISLPTLSLTASLSDGQLFNVAALLSQARALHPQSTRISFRR